MAVTISVSAKLSFGEISEQENRRLPGPFYPAVNVAKAHEEAANGTPKYGHS